MGIHCGIKAKYCYSLMKKFNSIDPEKVTANYYHRFGRDDILKAFDVLRVSTYPYFILDSNKKSPS